MELVKCKTLSNYECGRIAAFIDSEGCIWINKGNNNHASIEITNTNYRLIDYLKTTLGCGSIYSYQVNHKCKTGYKFRIMERNNVLYLLQQIKDHLILKREQAILIIKLIEIKQSLHCEPIIGRSNEERQIMIEMKNLNKKGLL